MTNRKNHNSIIFLTTLSVYLGLVLVGGVTPSVFAQAAAAQKFDVKSEIKVKDDLDKNPDENDLFADSLCDLVQKLNNFSEEKIFDWTTKNSYQINGLIFLLTDNSPLYWGKNEFFNEKLSKQIDKSAVEISNKFFKKLSDLRLGGNHSHSVDYKFVFDNKNLVFTAKLEDFAGSKVSIQPFANELTNYLTQLTSNSKTAKEKVVAENTKITFENNQVFIVTRLARASIDELLADKTAR